MNITLQHLIFWQQHQPMPNWAKQVLKKQYQVSVHSLIPVPKTKSVSPEVEPDNLIAILKTKRKHRKISITLLEMALKGYAKPKRKAYIMRWLHKMNRRQK